MERERRRRFWSDDEKRRIVAATYEPGVSVSTVARRFDVNANLAFTWRRDPRFNTAGAGSSFLPVEVSPDSAVASLTAGVVMESEERPDPAPDDPGELVPKGTTIELGHGMRLCFADVITEASLLRIVTALRRRA
jgi:transposase